MKQYIITGMSCAACSSRIEKTVAALSGVESCSVSLLTNSLTVVGTADEGEIISAVTKIGYGAAPKDEKRKTASAGEENGKKEIGNLKRRLFLSLVFLLALSYFSMGHNMFSLPLPPFFEANPIANALVQMLLSIIVMIINQRFFVNGFKGLIHRAPNMDTLIAIGSFSAFSYSTFALFKMTADPLNASSYLHDLYFESAAMILTLITVGKLLEAISKGKTTDALNSLRKLAPETVTVVRGDEEVLLPVEELNCGDIFIVRPGESIAADGVVIDGVSAVNESALTGESIPVDKEVGDKVSAATINQSGVLKCRATSVGEDTVLAKIIKMVSDASATKAPISKIADKVSGIFVPTVMAIAFITFIVWAFAGEGIGYAISRGISVLVVSCPCALGLATPVAIMVGNGIGAKNGILFKTGESLEKLGKASVIALDKTGTITLGEGRVCDVLPLSEFTEDDLLCVAYSLEYHSEHPIAKAIVAYAKENAVQNHPIVDFEIVSGSGLTGKLSGSEVFGGSLKYIRRIITVDAETENLVNRLADQGKTPVLFLKDKRLLGIITVADAIKSDSAKSVEELKNMGIHVVMLTGDNERTAKTVGNEVGVDEIVADVRPQDKEAAVRKLKSRGTVVMVGDGINDAPALTEADVGIAIGAGTDVAIDAAEIVLVNSKLSDVTAALRLSRKTFRAIRQNLFWAFFYNVVSIPIAVGAFAPLGLVLNPMIGAAAMSLSSFCVVCNALRLNLCDIRSNKHDKKMKNRKRKNLIMKKTVNIQGMMCPHCEARVQKLLLGLEHVVSAEVSHVSGTAVLTLSANVSDAEIKTLIEADGYTVTSIC